MCICRYIEINRILSLFFILCHLSLSPPFIKKKGKKNFSLRVVENFHFKFVIFKNQTSKNISNSYFQCVIKKKGKCTENEEKKNKKLFSQHNFPKPKLSFLASDSMQKCSSSNCYSLFFCTHIKRKRRHIMIKDMM